MPHKKAHSQQHQHKDGHGHAQTAKADHATNPAVTTSLFSGKVGDQGHVAQIKTHNHREVQKLMALGVLPGVPIRLIRKFPSFVFQLGYSQFTVDETLAKKIQVIWK